MCMHCSEDQFNVYVKHRVALDAKSRARKLRNSQGGKGKSTNPLDSDSVSWGNWAYDSGYG